jgi:hypothetical protein
MDGTYLIRKCELHTYRVPANINRQAALLRKDITRTSVIG